MSLFIASLLIEDASYEALDTAYKIYNKVLLAKTARYLDAGKYYEHITSYFENKYDKLTVHEGWNELMMKKMHEAIKKERRVDLKEAEKDAAHRNPDSPIKEDEMEFVLSYILAEKNSALLCSLICNSKDMKWFKAGILDLANLYTIPSAGLGKLHKVIKKGTIEMLKKTMNSCSVEETEFLKHGMSILNNINAFTKKDIYLLKKMAKHSLGEINCIAELILDDLKG